MGKTEADAAVVHPFAPVWDAESEILILGSFPSVKSRENGFYYGHPQNRFWPLMMRLFNVQLGSIDDKRSFLISHHIALSDAASSCRIHGSADSALTDAVANDAVREILSGAKIKAVYANGSKAYELAVKLLGLEGVVKLPSTSPANASWTMARLCDEWQAISDMLSITDRMPEH